MPEEPNRAGNPPSLEEPQGRTVVIHWIEESHHRVAVQVAPDFDPDARDLPNGLAALSDDGFEFVERTVVEVSDTEFDTDAEFFDPPGVAMADDASTPTPTDEVLPVLPAELAAVTIPGDVWRSFLAQETTLDDEHPGAVSLSAVVGEILRMVAANP